jgi:hypothetical protein
MKDYMIQKGEIPMWCKRPIFCLFVPWLFISTALCLSESANLPIAASFSGSASTLNGKNGELLGGPVLGYVFDRASREFREITGIPGVALAGRLIQPELPVSSAWISPKLPMALSQAPGGELMLVNLAERVATCRILGTPDSRVTKVYWSPSGTSAALVKANSGTLLLFQFTPTAASSLREVVTRGLQGKISSLAISDDGQQILAGVVEAEGSTLQMILPNGSSQLIVSLPSVSALSFRPTGRSVYVADRIGNALYCVNGIPENPQISPVGAGNLELAGPLALAFNSAGDKLVILNADAPHLSVVDLKSNLAFRLDARLAADQLNPWPSGNVFQLQEYSGSPLPLLELTPLENRLSLVPADPDRWRARLALESQQKNAASRLEREGRNR